MPEPIMKGAYVRDSVHLARNLRRSKSCTSTSNLGVEGELHHSEAGDERRVAHGSRLGRDDRGVHRAREALGHDRLAVAAERGVDHVEAVEPHDELAPGAPVGVRVVARDRAGGRAVVRERDLLAGGRGRVRDREGRVGLHGERGVVLGAARDELRGEREGAAGEEGRVEGPVPGLLLEHRRGDPAGVAGFDSEDGLFDEHAQVSNSTRGAKR